MNYVTSHYINDIMRCGIFRQLVDIDKVVDFAKVTSIFVSKCSRYVDVLVLCFSGGNHRLLSLALDHNVQRRQTAVAVLK